jgi:hypothetical protein
VGLVIGYPVHRILILKKEKSSFFRPIGERSGSARLPTKKCPPTSPAGQDLHSLKGGNREVGLGIGYPINRESNHLSFVDKFMVNRQYRAIGEYKVQGSRKQDQIQFVARHLSIAKEADRKLCGKDGTDHDDGE